MSHLPHPPEGNAVADARVSFAHTTTANLIFHNSEDLLATAKTALLLDRNGRLPSDKRLTQTMQAVKESVVMFPSMGIGHLIPTVELAKLFVGQGFSVTVVVVESPFGTFSVIEPLISRVSVTCPSISFHRLPKLTSTLSAKNYFVVSSEILRLANPHLLDFVRSRMLTSNVKALIIDMFTTAALDVAKELGIASYIYFSSAASSLVAFLQLPTLQLQLDGRSIKDLGDTQLHFPGLPPMPASSFPTQVYHHDEVNEAVVYHFKRMPTANGIIVNTFESLEKSAIQALADGVCLPGITIPPVYCIGPLVANDNRGEVEESRHECIAWLDEQPEKSVVFLCFGSVGSFSVEQLKEMADGLEKSGQRFLWVVRSPPSQDPTKMFGPKPEPDLEVLLPDGFLKRTEGRGMVVKSWAPQTAVLGHPSVGGFVSHCGWNSTLEAITEGVPVIAWPLYAEQRMNRVFLVEAKLVLEMEGYDKVVTAEEVERKIKLLMESDIEKVRKEQVVAMKQEALAARKEDGSSTIAFLGLVGVLRGRNS